MISNLVCADKTTLFHMHYRLLCFWKITVLFPMHTKKVVISKRFNAISTKMCIKHKSLSVCELGGNDFVQRLHFMDENGILDGSAAVWNFALRQSHKFIR